MNTYLVTVTLLRSNGKKVIRTLVVRACTLTEASAKAGCRFSGFDIISINANLASCTSAFN